MKTPSGFYFDTVKAGKGISFLDNLKGKLDTVSNKINTSNIPGDIQSDITSLKSAVQEPIKLSKKLTTEMQSTTEAVSKAERKLTDAISLTTTASKVMTSATFNNTDKISEPSNNKGTPNTALHKEDGTIERYDANGDVYLIYKDGFVTGYYHGMITFTLSETEMTYYYPNGQVAAVTKGQWEDLENGVMRGIFRDTELYETEYWDEAGNIIVMNDPGDQYNSLFGHPFNDSWREINEGLDFHCSMSYPHYILTNGFKDNQPLVEAISEIQEEPVVEPINEISEESPAAEAISEVQEQENTEAIAEVSDAEKILQMESYGKIRKITEEEQKMLDVYNGVAKETHRSLNGDCIYYDNGAIEYLGVVYGKVNFKMNWCAFWGDWKGFLEEAENIYSPYIKYNKKGDALAEIKSSDGEVFDCSRAHNGIIDSVRVSGWECRYFNGKLLETTHEYSDGQFAVDFYYPNGKSSASCIYMLFKGKYITISERYLDELGNPIDERTWIDIMESVSNYSWSEEYKEKLDKIKEQENAEVINDIQEEALEKAIEEVVTEEPVEEIKEITLSNGKTISLEEFEEYTEMLDNLVEVNNLSLNDLLQNVDLIADPEVRETIQNIPIEVVLAYAFNKINVDGKTTYGDLQYYINSVYRQEGYGYIDLKDIRIIRDTVFINNDSLYPVNKEDALYVATILKDVVKQYVLDKIKPQEEQNADKISEVIAEEESVEQKKPVNTNTWNTWASHTKAPSSPKEPSVEQPTETIQEPSVEQPTETIQEPSVEQPTETIQEPSVEQPTETIQEPSVEQPTETIQEPSVEQPTETIQEPSVEQPTETIQEPINKDSE